MHTNSKAFSTWTIVLYATAIASPVWAQQSDNAVVNPGCKNAAVAAIVGGIFGALVSDNKRTGAAIGAVVSSIACMALEASSKQTQSSTDVLKEYKDQNGGRAPDQVTLVRYDGSSPSSVVREKGSSVELTSTGQLVVPPGQQGSSQYFEEFQLSVPGEQPKIVKKPLGMVGGGGFEQSYKFALDKTLPQGDYIFKTRILSPDNQTLGERNGKFRVV